MPTPEIVSILAIMPAIRFLSPTVREFHFDISPRTIDIGYSIRKGMRLRRGYETQ